MAASIPSWAAALLGAATVGSLMGPACSVPEPSFEGGGAQGNAGAPADLTGGMETGRQFPAGGGQSGAAGAGGARPLVCAEDGDCEAQADRPRCDTDTGHCVECLVGDDTCGPGYYCARTQVCRLGCQSDEDCGEGTECNVISHYCVGCESPADCPVHHTCDTNTKICVAACEDREDCGPDQECCSGACQPVLDAVEHCGACGDSCPAIHGEPFCDVGECGIVCASGRGDCNENARRDGCETDLLTTTLHCGECGEACTNAHGGTDCIDGVCVPECIRGFDDCDRDASNGCEQDVVNDAQNCGACGQQCELPHADAGCDNVVCFVADCVDGWRDCDGNPANGCESDVATDPLNCGQCGRPCATTNGIPTCAEGSCDIECEEGFDDCDGDATNGCEVDLRSNVHHCSECFQACPDDEGTPRCSGGECFVSYCSEGLGDCDGDPDNECEADLASDPANCSDCGASCTVANGEPGCTDGTCEVGSCNGADPEAGLPPYGDCNEEYPDGCEQALTTLKHCGACNTACSAEQNVHTVTCGTGVCQVSNCMLPWGDCNGSPSDGCEVDTTTAVHHCGACGAACSQAHGTPTCENSVCSIACNEEYEDCDGNAMGNGCETHLPTDPSHCGGCQRVCTVENGTAGCEDGKCTVAACEAGFADCDRNPDTGCEVDTTSDAEHCGACNTPCSLNNAAMQGCEDSTCRVGTCLPGFDDCNGLDPDGCEVNLTSNAENCGECDSPCPDDAGTPVCRDSVCGISDCDEPYEDCDGDGATCEVNTSNDADNCGGCGLGCDYPHATGFCQASDCAFGDCSDGWGSCDSDLSDGCETNLSTTAAHCGDCGDSCSTNHGTPTCDAGECTIGCESGWGNCDGNARSNGCETSVSANTTHCGVCDRPCGAGQLCEDGECIDLPCTGLCSDPFEITTLPFQGSDLGTDPICHVTLTQPGSYQCTNMSNRNPRINGVSMNCNGGAQSLAGVAPRAGGYCIQVDGGGYEWAYYGLNP